jgi:hypothetical protein
MMGRSRYRSTHILMVRCEPSASLEPREAEHLRMKLLAGEIDGS